jgi:hypothetical protein
MALLCFNSLPSLSSLSSSSSSRLLQSPSFASPGNVLSLVSSLDISLLLRFVVELYREKKKNNRDPWNQIEAPGLVQFLDCPKKVKFCFRAVRF